ncbi:MAG: pyruvate kinase [Ruminococcus sp.]|nr:pyruvate kinase [Ruminococcus sp.]
MTKIVCTMGPACDDVKILTKMIKAGMNVARFNMSHGTYDEQKARFDRVKEAVELSGKNIAMLLDTKGPEIRIGTFPDNSVEVEEGQQFRLYSKPDMGDENGVSLSYPKLVDVFKKDKQSVGRQILFDDGKIIAEVVGCESDAIVCKILNAGKLSNRKSINIPGYDIHMPYISASDRADIEFGLQQGVNVVAASFVRSADDVLKMRDFIDSLGYEDVEIVAKIENQSGVDDIDRIIAVADGIMIARGDMGVEIPFIKLPQIQKMIIRKCVLAGKYVITATQMLESMTNNIRPTRAEISDVANAVYDGTSAVMLSGESAAGDYPVESVKALADICAEAETNHDLMDLKNVVGKIELTTNFRDNICYSAKHTAEHIGAKAIIAESQTGAVARAMAHYRPECPIIAVVTTETVCKKLSLNWGITAILGEELQDADAINNQAIEKALKTGIVKKGDTVIVISSNKVVPTGGTDTLNIRIV